MKKITQYLFLAAALITAMTSCKGFLDQEPSDGVKTAMAVGNYNEAITALNGMYDALQGNSNFNDYYGARMIYYGDVRGDYMQARAQGMRSSSCYEMIYTANDAPTIWRSPYMVISRANLLLKAIEDDKVTDATDEEIAQIQGQCLVLRALAHFDLCRVYGKPYTVDNGASLGIPIITKQIDPTAQPTRATVAQVYKQVIDDLLEAEKKLVVTAEEGKKPNYITTGYANLWTAKALLSRVYLYKGDNENALAMAEDVIDNSPYALWSTSAYASSWAKPGNSEMIFEVVNYDNSDWVDREFIGYLMDENGYADIILTSKLTKILESKPSDVRNSITKPSAKYKDYGTTKVFCAKFPGTNAADTRVGNVPILRLSEIYLNAAEAAVKLNDQATAAKYYNTISQRADPNALTLGVVTLDQVIAQRGLELFGEGHRFFDLMRNNMEVDRTDHWTYILPRENTKFNNTYYRTILPIPKSECDANPAIAAQQNSGY